MQSKLTLRLDDHLISEAKAYAAITGKSLSQIVADYFAFLVEVQEQKPTLSLPPTTASLVGLLEGTTADEETYRDYLAEKHQ